MREAEGPGGLGWRYTAWVKMVDGTASWAAPVHDELFDLRASDGADFDDDAYAANVAAAQPAVVARLRATLKAAVLSWY